MIFLWYVYKVQNSWASLSHARKRYVYGIRAAVDLDPKNWKMKPDARSTKKKKKTTILIKPSHSSSVVVWHDGSPLYSKDERTWWISLS